MPKLLRIILLVCSVISLTACGENQEKSIDYYLQNPRPLSRAVTSCQAASLIEREAPRCRLVMEAAGKMMELIEAYQQNPQAFGQRILAAEMKNAATGGQNQQEVNSLLAVVGLNSPE